MIYKLRKAFHRGLTLLLFFFARLVLPADGQETSYTRPPVTGKIGDYKKQVMKDPSKKMIELKAIAPTIVYDLRYAGSNNFMRRPMYPAATRYTFLRSPAARALKKVQDELNTKGLGIRIWDAYRPYSVTVRFWELVKNEDYVAHPSRGSGHNRGTAVDLTLIDLRSGTGIDMGTDFDNFSDTAHHGFTKLPGAIRQNRQLLKTQMEKHGFRSYEKEWWHYAWPDASEFELLDIDFRKLK